MFIKSKITKALVIAALAFSVTACSPVSVDEGEIGLVTRYGEIQEELGAGLHWRTWLEDDVKFSQREQKFRLGTFGENGDVVTGISAYTRDTQTVTTALTITYKIKDAVQIYKNYRTTENMVTQLLEPRSRQALEIVYSQYTAQKALENRAGLSADITEAIRNAVKDYPIEITSVQSVIQFSPEYEKRVEESVQKNVAIQTAERELLVQQKQAEVKRVMAQAEADAKIIEAKAQAEAIKIQGEALKENSKLVELKAVEKWDGRLPVYQMGNTTPMINLNTK